MPIDTTQFTELYFLRRSKYHEMETYWELEESSKDESNNDDSVEGALNGSTLSGTLCKERVGRK